MTEKYYQLISTSMLTLLTQLVKKYFGNGFWNDDYSGSFV